MANVIGKSVNVETRDEYEQAMEMADSVRGEFDGQRGQVEFTTIAAAVAAWRVIDAPARAKWWREEEADDDRPLDTTANDQSDSDYRNYGDD